MRRLGTIWLRHTSERHAQSAIAISPKSRPLSHTIQIVSRALDQRLFRPDAAGDRQPTPQARPGSRPQLPAAHTTGPRGGSQLIDPASTLPPAAMMPADPSRLDALTFAPVDAPNQANWHARGLPRPAHPKTPSWRPVAERHRSRWRAVGRAQAPRPR